MKNNNFLQSEMWRKFQESVGRRTFFVEDEKDVKSHGDHVPSFSASIIEHSLPIVGKYFYIPRGPIITITNDQETKNKQIKNFFGEIINLAKENKIGWARIDPENENILELLKDLKIKKAPHDMQPREVFVVDISKPEEELLAGMKEKTRYNIKLAQKKGVKIEKCDMQPVRNALHNDVGGNEACNKNIEDFLKLIKQTSERKGIKSHPENYYRKMLETFPEENVKLYLAEYSGKIIAGTLVIYFGKTATYLHGASSDECRNVMAPYLLQWQAIQDAKKAGMEMYDMGGIKTVSSEQETGKNNSWAGITKFKTGFSPNAKPLEFPGSYDIVINPSKYAIYRALQKLKSLK